MAVNFELEGVLKVINETQTFASGFAKREFVLEVEDGRFPQMIKFETVKERTSLLDSFREGDKLRVSFDIRGNEYQGRYFVNLNAWKIEKAGSTGSDRQPDPVGGDEPPWHASEPPAGYGRENDDIPF